MSRDLLSIRRVADKISHSRSWIYLRVREKKFPAPLNLKLGKNLWDSRAIDEWIDARVKNASAE